MLNNVVGYCRAYIRGTYIWGAYIRGTYIWGAYIRVGLYSGGGLIFGGGTYSRRFTVSVPKQDVINFNVFLLFLIDLFHALLIFASKITIFVYRKNFNKFQCAPLPPLPQYYFNLGGNEESRDQR